jgi:hypothetical protein
MEPLSAFTVSGFALVTPIFGLALAPPADIVPLDVIAISELAPRNAQEGEDEGADESVEPAVEETEEAASGGGDMDDYARQMRERADLIAIHRPLAIATWAVMGVTLIAGGIQFHNLYGTWSDLGDTPCVTGDAIFGQGQCWDPPWIHRVLWISTTALYTATFITSVMMPAPDDLDEGDSDYASNLRLHKILRWVHFGGMIAQIALGIIIANSESFGLDRANDYGALQALATTHLALGLVTWGAMTWAGAIFTL